jgi:hypothetical protein
MLEGPARELRPGEDLGEALDAALASLRTRWRAVTEADYVELLREQWPTSTAAAPLGAAASLGRVHCLGELDLRPAAGPVAAPGRVSVVVVPRAGGDPTPALLATL